MAERRVLRETDKIVAMLDGLTSFERRAVSESNKAEEAWRLGQGNPESVKAWAIRWSGVLRMRASKRKTAGEDAGDFYSPLAYLERVLTNSAERFVTFNAFGCDAALPEIEEVLA